MVEVSKFIVQKSRVGELPCNILIHPWAATCTEANLTMMLACMKGSFTFFTPFQALFLVSSLKLLSFVIDSKCIAKLL